MEAYLQNSQAQYYFIDDDGRVGLTDNRVALQVAPEVIDSTSETEDRSPGYGGFDKSCLLFRNDGCRIVSHIFFRQLKDCILTLTEGISITGNLDFSSARVYGNREIHINCIHF